MSSKAFTQAKPLSEKEKHILDVIDSCRYDPALFGISFFAGGAFGKDFCKMHHDLIYAYLDETKERVICLAPRFHGKSAITTFLLPLHAAIYHPQIINGGLQIVASETEKFAFARLNTIKHEIETNRGLNSIYGSLEGNRWQEAIFNIRNDDMNVNSNLLARSTGQQFQGIKIGHRRPYFIWMDDVEGREDSVNPEMVTKNLEWLDSVVERSLDHINNGRMFYVATLMAENSMTHILSQRESWYTMLYSAVQPDGNMLWPEAYPKEKFLRDYDAAIAEERKDGFWLEMMNLPLNPDTKELRMEHIQYYSAQDLLQESEEKTLMHNYVIVDPSFSSEKDSDITGIAVVGLNDRGEYLIHDGMYSHSKEPISITNDLIPFILKYSPVGVHIESFGAQNMLPGLITGFLRNENILTPVYGMRGSYKSGAKAARIRSFISKIKSGKVLFNRDSQAVRQIIREFLAFPHKLRGGDYDVIDAISYSAQIGVQPKVVRGERRESDWDYMERRRRELMDDYKMGERDSRI